MECHYENERIIYMKIKYGRGKLVVIGAYSPEEMKKDQTKKFFGNSKNKLIKMQTLEFC